MCDQTRFIRMNGWLYLVELESIKRLVLKFSKKSSERNDEGVNLDSETVAVEFKEGNDVTKIIDHESDERTEEQIYILN